MYVLKIKDLQGNENCKMFFDSQQEAESYLLEAEQSLKFGELNSYASSIEDMSTELSAQLSKQESIEALNLGMDIMADIRTLNKAKIAAQTLDFAALLADQTVANIERALWNGSLDTAKALINGLQ